MKLVLASYVPLVKLIQLDLCRDLHVWLLEKSSSVFLTPVDDQNCTKISPLKTVSFMQMYHGCDHESGLHARIE